MFVILFISVCFFLEAFEISLVFQKLHNYGQVVLFCFTHTFYWIFKESAYYDTFDGAIRWRLIHILILYVLSLNCCHCSPHPFNSFPEQLPGLCQSYYSDLFLTLYHISKISSFATTSLSNKCSKIKFKCYHWHSVRCYILYAMRKFPKLK